MKLLVDYVSEWLLASFCSNTAGFQANSLVLHFASPTEHNIVTSKAVVKKSG